MDRPSTRKGRAGQMGMDHLGLGAAGRSYGAAAPELLHKLAFATPALVLHLHLHQVAKAFSGEDHCITLLFLSLLSPGSLSTAHRLLSGYLLIRCVTVLQDRSGDTVPNGVSARLGGGKAQTGNRTHC